MKKTKKTNSSEKLIEVAIDLFAVNGFKGTSIRDIAKKTGMTISNIYYYFGNKDGLLLAILKRSSNRLIEKLKEENQHETDPLESLKRLIITHLNFVNEYKRESKIFFLDEEHLSPEGHRINNRFQVEILNLYRSHLQILKESGYLTYGNITIVAFNILGIINWHLRWYKPGGSLTLEQINHQVLNFILYGVLGTPEKLPLSGDTPFTA
jgi:AcrR family transcriptional regulator